MKYLILCGAVLAGKFPADKVKGETEHSYSNIFSVSLKEGVHADCATYVINYLEGKGVHKNQIVTRTNENLGKYGQVCSFMIQDHATKLFDIQGAQVYAVRDVPRVKANFVEAPVGNTTEKIHGPTGVMDARNKLGLTGKGVKVGVIDSGVYYLHPALGGGFGAGFKVSSGHDFVGDDYTGGTNSIPVPDDDPLDNCSSSSHGTHVAGIVAANAVGITAEGFIPAVTFTGAAPDAEIGAYRVFGCQGGAGDDIIAAAVRRAASDGCHIINMSLGGGSAFRDSPDSVAVSDVAKLGHLIFAASGNAGDEGLYSSGAPASSDSAFGVGSADNFEQPTTYMSVGSIDYSITFGSDSPAFPPAFDISNIVINDVDAETNDTRDDGLSPTCNPAVAGFPVLIRWGTVGGTKGRCNQAKKCGATHCILYAYNEDIVDIAGGDEIPSLFVEHQAGLDIRAAIAAGSKSQFVVHAEITKLFPIFTAGQISVFSSSGLDNDLFIKPDIVGIGGFVYSTLSPFDAGYGMMSGTSMATPNTAGIAALYLQHQFKSSQEINFGVILTKLQNGATPMKMPKSELLESVAVQGSGLINVYNAIMHQTTVVPSALALNDTIRTLKSYEIEITNEGSAVANYKLTSIGAAFVEPFVAGDDATQIWTATKVSENYAIVEFSEESFSVSAQSSKKITVTFTAPTTIAYLPIYSGFLVVSNDVEEIPIHVPYAGVIGDWSEAPIFSRVSETLGAVGLYDMENNLIEKIANATEGILVMTQGATASRMATLDVEYLGADLDEFAALNLDIKKIPEPILYTVNDDNDLDFAGVFGGSFLRNTPGLGGNGVDQVIRYIWKGAVGTVDTTADMEPVELPAGDYKFIFKALKHFKGPTGGSDISDYDIIEQEITLVYGTSPEGPCEGYNCPEVTTTKVVDITTGVPTTLVETTSCEETTVEVTTTCEETTTVEPGYPGTTVVDITIDGPTETDGSIISSSSVSTFGISSLFSAIFLII